MDYSSLTRLGVKYQLGQTLASFTSMKIGGECDIMLMPDGEEALRRAVSICREEKIPYLVLGRGSNVLIREFRGCVITLSNNFSGITVDGTRLTALAGTSLAAICNAALEQSLSGVEFAYGIPGSAGGALYMNAGAYGGEMKDVVLSCRYIDERGELCEMSRDEMGLCYRHSVFAERDCVITSVTIELQSGDSAAIKARMDELMSRRREKQPLEFPSCGSTFKRPKEGFAAAFIEECGLKGFTAGGAQVSEKHSGFVINKGGATFDDVMAVVRHVKDTVRRQKGVELECEIKIIDKA